MVIARRELVRFLRQPMRIAAAIGTPIMLWLLMGSGFVGAYKPAALGDMGYGQFLLPGMVTLTAVFASVFSAISVIEDRNDGWLQGALVSPAPRWAIGMGKIMGGSIPSFAQASVLLALLPTLDVQVSVGHAALALAAVALTCLALTAMGLAFAWGCETTASFHGVMNLVLMPMWLLSGAFFPPAGASSWLAWIMRLNPLTWCTQAIREPLSGRTDVMALAVCGAFAAAMCAIAIGAVSRRHHAGLRRPAARRSIRS